MADRRAGIVTAITLIFAIVLLTAGCEAPPKGPTTMLGGSNVYDRALAKANTDLTRQRDEIKKKYDILLAKMKETKRKEQAWMIFQNEVDVIIDELARLGGAVRRKNRIALQDKFFFKPGSIVLTRQGQGYLLDIARHLRNIDHLIRVEGHTDNVPVSNPDTRRRFIDNWGLSAARAAAVLRFMQEKGGIPGERLIGVFYGPFRPIEANSKKGNSKNRRVELQLVSPYSEEETQLEMPERPTIEQPADKPLRGTENYLDGRRAPQPVAPEGPRKPEGIRPAQPVPPVQPVQPDEPEEDPDPAPDGPVIIVQ